MFYFRLAAHFGCSVRELLFRIDSHEIAEWRAFEMIEGPIGQSRDDILAAIVTAAIVNSNRERKKPYPVTDFIPKWDRTKPTTEELFNKLVGINAAIGGEIVGR